MGEAHLLVLDDDEVFATVTARGLRSRGYFATVATSGFQAIAMGRAEAFDLLLADVHLPDMDGLDVAMTMRQWSPDLVVVTMSGESSLDLALAAMDKGAQALIVKPFSPDLLARRIACELERARLARENLRLRLLTPVLEETLGVLAAAIDARDHTTATHASRLPRLAEALARAAGLDDEAVEGIRRGALLHDIGKIGVPDSILNKVGSLTDEEQRQMRQHPEIGANLVSHLSLLRPAVDVIRHHHECWDGSGYPAGFAGEAIPIGARIVALVDAFDAMISPRPYRQATSPLNACVELRRAAGRQFDPRLTKLFLAQVEGAFPTFATGLCAHSAERSLVSAAGSFAEHD